MLALRSCALTLPMLLFTLPSAAMGDTADTIYRNGTIITVDDSAPTVEAVAIADGIIIAVGSTNDVLKTKGDLTKIIDLAGRTMLPGFVDAHGHVMGGGLQALSANLLSPPDGQVKSIAALQDTLRTWIADNKQAVDKIQLVIGLVMTMPSSPSFGTPTEKTWTLYRPKFRFAWFINRDTSFP